ncbi:hypothetical protein Ocin01_04007 [Orchesella cincta]|uniref:NADAR domain-containing protein n=1 Tax=Orchesella cincta TaxID=48709 RepID=A0A1D2NCH3_ORCCI|nr:hypothetical protein Ocin01_04007 [Orchesella cincta]
MEDLNTRDRRGYTVFLALFTVKSINKKYSIPKSNTKILKLSSLRRRVALAAMSCDPEERFTFFWKSRSPFSQFHPSPFHGKPLYCTTPEDSVGYTFAHCEQWMMFNKAKLFQDEESARKILAETQPEGCKALGRKVKGFIDILWKQENESIVKAGNRLKFTQNPDLMRELMQTDGTTLAEASPFDRVYGIGLSAENPMARFRVNWRGQNLLGEILTGLREELKAEGYGPGPVSQAGSASK